MPENLSDVPVPDLADPLFGPYWEGTRAGRLRIQACAACGTLRWPPRYMCPACGSFETEWVERAPRGKVYSWTVVGFATARGYPDVPYPVVIVALDEAPSVRVVGRMVGADPDELVAGMPVQARFVPAGADDAMTLIQWEPREV